MKLYMNLCSNEFVNSYTLVNEDSEPKKAVIIDPGKISVDMIDQIETQNIELDAILVTHSHKNHILGIKTLQKIYCPKIYCADINVLNVPERIVLKGDGSFCAAGINFEYFFVPGHSSDSIIYKTAGMLFTGDAIMSGLLGSTPSSYSKKLLVSKIRQKLYDFPDSIVIFPGHGTPSTLGSEKIFNLDL